MAEQAGQEQNIAGPGHNRPPAILKPEDILNDLGDRYSDITGRADELLASQERMPAAIDNEETAGKFTDQGGIVAAAIKRAEAKRVEEKTPYLEAGKVIDGFFRIIQEKLRPMKSDIERKLTTYQVAKERAERERLEKLAAEESKRAQPELDKAIEAGDFDKADKIVGHVRAAEKKADAPAADMSRSRGQYGAVSSIRKIWKHIITDRNKIPLASLRPYLSEDCLDKAIRGFVRAGGRELKGVDIFQESKTTIKG